MKKAVLHVLGIGSVICLVCLSVNAEPTVFSVTQVVRDAGIELTGKVIQQQVGIQTVPEPSALLLLGSALSGFIGFRARRRFRK